MEVLNHVLPSCGHKKRFEKTARPPGFVPSLYEDVEYDESDGVELGLTIRFRDSCLLVLSALWDKRFDGMWTVPRETATRLWSELDYNANLRVETNELISLSRENAGILMQLPSALQGLRNTDLIRDAMKEFDPAQDGLDAREWSSFLETLSVIRARYLLEKALLHKQCYFASSRNWKNVTIDDGTYHSLIDMAQETLIMEAGDKSEPGEGLDDEAVAAWSIAKRRRYSSCQCGLDKDGYVDWVSDLIYFSANNHPLHAIFCCDQNNALSKSERVAIEIAAIGFATGFEVLLLAGYIARVESRVGVGRFTERADVSAVRFWAVVGMTIPVMILRKMLELLFTMPKCGQADASVDTEQDIRRAQYISIAGKLYGNLVVLLTTVCTIAVFFSLGTGFKHILLARILQSTVVRYFLSWLLMLIRQFNPILAVGDLNHRFEHRNFFAKHAKIGQWRIEKQHFQKKLVEVIITKQGHQAEGSYSYYSDSDDSTLE